MRSHPVVGTLFVFLGVGFVVAGGAATSGTYPRTAVPLEVLVPFILWQFAAWSILMGVFFLRRRAFPKRRVVAKPVR